MTTTKKCGKFVFVETWFTTSPEQLKTGGVRPPIRPAVVVVRRSGLDRKSPEQPGLRLDGLVVAWGVTVVVK